METFEDLNKLGFGNMRFLENHDNVDLDSVNKGMLDPIYDLLDRGGKRWRPILGLACAECLGTDISDLDANKELYYLMGAAELIHNASLIIDDLEDGSLKRRGDHCTYIKYGTDIAVNAGNFLYYTPMRRASEVIKDP